VTPEGDRFTVRVTGPAGRAIGRMDPKVVDAVLAFIAGPLADNPMRVTKPLTGELAGKRSGYVGIAFRVLVEVDEEQRIVWVLKVAHRADVYRP
jgi:mRNA interferase RelE/StbE